MRLVAGWRLVGLNVALRAACAAYGQTATPAESVIHVEISGLRSDNGQMLCALYSSAQAEAFPKKADKAVARLTAKIAERAAVCDFLGIAPGTYAVSVVHDENSNGKLAREWERRMMLRGTWVRPSSVPLRFGMRAGGWI
jgi:uncharacterized protein (DUF2141 family)